MSSSPLSLCFVALNAYPTIDPAVVGAIGGIETRAWMLARSLAGRRDFAVDFVVRHTAPVRQAEFDQVRLRPITDRLYRLRESVSTRVKKSHRFPFLNVHSFTPALLWQIPLLVACRPFRGTLDPWQPAAVLTHPTPDVYCTFGVQSYSATVIASARQVSRPVVLFLGSDSDLDERYTADSNYISPYQDRGDTCWKILQSADLILCQTHWQQETLRARFGREGRILLNPIDVDAWDAGMCRQPAHPVDVHPGLPGDVSATESGGAVTFLKESLQGLDRYLLWVGRAERTHKRPQLFVQLAESLPQIPCVMILNPREDGLEDELHRTAPANLRIIPSVPFPLMPRLFSQAAALVSTSSLEGFPNVFLQAGLSRVPVISLAVGEEFLAESGVGVCCMGEWDRFVTETSRVWNSPPSRTEVERAREYIVNRHALPEVVSRLAEILQELAPSH